jgi:hypothetical protein
MLEGRTADWVLQPMRRITSINCAGHRLLTLISVAPVLVVLAAIGLFSNLAAATQNRLETGTVEIRQVAQEQVFDGHKVKIHISLAGLKFQRVNPRLSTPAQALTSRNISMNKRYSCDQCTGGPTGQSRSKGNGRSSVLNVR